MTEMAPEVATPDWVLNPAPCKHCGCSWHAVPCETCSCETSCLAPVLIIPPNVILGAE